MLNIHLELMYFLERLKYDENGDVMLPDSWQKQRKVESITQKENEEMTPPRKFENSNKQNYDYAVEDIVKYEWKNNKHMFLIKWKNYEHCSNTWEPLINLNNCTELIVNYLTNYLNMELLTQLWDKLNLSNEKHIDAIQLKVIKNPWNLMYKYKLQKRLLTLLVMVNTLNRKIVPLYKVALINYVCYTNREKQLAHLEAWKKDINQLVTNLGEAVILIENNVDLKWPPKNFVYVNEYIPGANIFIPDNPPFGCSCVECGPRDRNCCGKETQFAYTKNARIAVKLGTPIYECNKMCKCDVNCRNRVVQKPRRIPLCIFKTDNGRGWGVKTMKNIYAGQYICQYVGELITYEEAEIRGKRYDKMGMTYLFDLDFNSKDKPYVVDATEYGNVSHFINHSCEPNVGVWSVWTNCLDPDIPSLALFALTNIKKGTELTFDYMASKVNDKKMFKKTLCRCNSENCRKYLF